MAGRTAALGKKGATYVPREYVGLLNELSKAALMDIAWNMALLGTDETPEQVIAQVAREARIVCEGRGDRLPRELATHANRIIDSDPT